MNKITSVEIPININTDIVSIDKYIDQSAHLIPKIRKSNSDSLITVDIFKSSHNVLQYDSDSFKIGGNYDPYQLTMDSIMILSRYLENVLNDKNQYSIHSSALCYNNEGILFIGNSGVGKTTIAKDISNKNNNTKFISGDRTVLIANKIIGGTEKISFRKGSLVHDFPNSKTNIVSDKKDWQTYEIINGDQLHTPIPIKAIFQVYRNNSELNICELEKELKFLRFYENISYFANTFPNIVLGQKKAIINSTCDQDARIEFSEAILKDIPIIAISGSMKDISEYINNEYLS